MKRRTHRPNLNPKHSRDPAVIKIGVVPKKQRQALTFRQPRHGGTQPRLIRRHTNLEHLFERNAIGLWHSLSNHIAGTVDDDLRNPRISRARLPKRRTNLNRSNERLLNRVPCEFHVPRNRVRETNELAKPRSIHLLQPHKLIVSRPHPG